MSNGNSVNESSVSGLIVKDGHQHNTDDCFNELLNDAIRNSYIQNDSDNDNCGFLKSDKQLAQRSRSITNILDLYRDMYSYKVDFQKKYRVELYTTFMRIISILITVVVLLAIAFGFGVIIGIKIDVSSAATMIATVISLIVAVLELIRMITKYCFPENDDSHIVKIVEAIQQYSIELIKTRNCENEDTKEYSNK